MKRERMPKRDRKEEEESNNEQHERLDRDGQRSLQCCYIPAILSLFLSSLIYFPFLLCCLKPSHFIMYGNSNPTTSSVGVENVTPNYSKLTPFVVKQMFSQQPVKGSVAWADQEGGGWLLV